MKDTMKKNVLVFAGTSITHEDAANILDATYMPPASRGDIIKAANKGYELIGIIDGIFFSRAAVAHREIIAAMKEGITIVGGCSMGALRASELDVHGMIGVGRIYEWYRDSIIEDDDEVAVATNPDTYKPVSNPMVNIRETLKKALLEDIIEKKECIILLSIAKRTHYAERSYFGITKEAFNEGLISRERTQDILNYCNEHEEDIKRKDALMVLEKLKSCIKGHKDLTPDTL